MKFEYSGGGIVYTYKEGKRVYLLLKSRGRGGYWGFPKGHVEKGENMADAAVRETREESGIRVRLIPYFKQETKYLFTRNRIKVEKSVAFFLARLPRPIKPTIQKKEIQASAWMEMEKAMKAIPFDNIRAALKEADAYVNKMESMDKLNMEYAALPEKTKGWDLSKNLVPGHGPLDARLMVVGQAPGRNEDIQRRPFIGISGRLLDHLFKIAGTRRENIYITSAVQFFPPENRMPTDEEVAACKDFLMRQIEIVKPAVVVTLGSLSGRILVDVDNIMENHGRITKKEGITYFSTIHPAAAVRLKKHVPLIEEDFRKLKALLKPA
ncbi:MAG TPA: uracil-DNA glycosylase family protein [Candidatus Baltobacteraceae bacterium]|nr:uracil-DNA glycosylase family protein [Candidatus Baltobacteraceae bacterium]